MKMMELSTEAPTLVSLDRLQEASRCICRICLDLMIHFNYKIGCK